MTRKKVYDDTKDIPPPPSPLCSDTGQDGRGLSPLPHLLTIDEVADVLRTTRPAVYGLINRGALHGVVRISRRVLIDRVELQAWIEKQRVKPLLPWPKRPKPPLQPPPPPTPRRRIRKDDGE